MRIVNRGFKRVQSRPVQEPQVEEKQDFTLEELDKTESKGDTSNIEELVIEEPEEINKLKMPNRRKRNSLEDLLSEN